MDSFIPSAPRPDTTKSSDTPAQPTLPHRFSELSQPRRSLVRLCQGVNYGCVHDLEIKDCDPVFDPHPVVIVDVKLDAEASQRPEIELADFTLCHEMCRLMELFDELRDATVDRIEVRAGVPRRVLFKSWPKTTGLGNSSRLT
jgi:hypothetical protein